LYNPSHYAWRDRARAANTDGADYSSPCSSLTGAASDIVEPQLSQMNVSYPRDPSTDFEACIATRQTGQFCNGGRDFTSPKCTSPAKKAT